MNSCAHFIIYLLIIITRDVIFYKNKKMYFQLNCDFLYMVKNVMQCDVNVEFYL